MMAVMAIWDRIHAWLEANAPEILNSLMPGASEEQLDTLQEKLELNNLPEDFKASYRIHNGSSAQYFFGSPDDCNSFSPIEDITSEWLMHKKVHNTSDNGEYKKEKKDEGLEIQSVWWSPKWLPFGGDHCGNYLYLDMAPTEVGTYGQIIQWYHDGGDPELLASSFTQYLSQFANALEAEMYHVTNDDGYLSLLRKDLKD